MENQKLTKQIMIRVSESQFDKIVKQAKEEGRDVSNLIRFAVEKYLKNKK